MHPWTTMCWLKLPHVPWNQTPPPYSGGLRRCHVSHSSGTHLPAWEGSIATTCPMAPYPISLLRKFLVLPCVPRLQTPPPCSGGLRHCHVSCDPQRAAALKNKERLSWPNYAAGLACFQGVTACFRDACHPSHHGMQDVRVGGTNNACKACGQAATLLHWPCRTLTRDNYSVR
jgi:hypothetical protein